MPPLADPHTPPPDWETTATAALAHESSVFQNVAWTETAILQASRQRVPQGLHGEWVVWDDEQLRRGVLDALLQRHAPIESVRVVPLRISGARVEIRHTSFLVRFPSSPIVMFLLLQFSGV